KRLSCGVNHEITRRVDLDPIGSVESHTVWISKYGADTVARQAPIKTELKFNVWIVTGSASTEMPLFAFILQADGRVLSVGGPTKRLAKSCGLRLWWEPHCDSYL